MGVPGGYDLCLDAASWGRGRGDGRSRVNLRHPPKKLHFFHTDILIPLYIASIIRPLYKG